MQRRGIADRGAVETLQGDVLKGTVVDHSALLKRGGRSSLLYRRE